MDLSNYFKKVRELESQMPDEHVLVVSKETADGGQEGVMTEVRRRSAAELILNGRARQAKPEEVEEYRLGEASRRDERQQGQELTPARPNNVNPSGRRAVRKTSK